MAAPYAAGVQTDGVEAIGMARDGRPVTKEDAISGGFPVGVAKPWGDGCGFLPGLCRVGFGPLAL